MRRCDIIIIKYKFMRKYAKIKISLEYISHYEFTQYGIDFLLLFFVSCYEYILLYIHSYMHM